MRCSKPSGSDDECLALMKEFSSQCHQKETAIMEGLCKAFMEETGLPVTRCAVVRQVIPTGVMWRMVEADPVPVQASTWAQNEGQLERLLDLVNSHLDACGFLEAIEKRKEYLMDPDAIADRLFQLQEAFHHE